MKFILICVALLMLLHVGEGCPRRRRRRPPPPPPRNCKVGSWTWWSSCSHQCGYAGTQTRTRKKTVTECCGGRCPYQFSESRACNRYACRNGGRPSYGRCSCNAGWTGTCCERDVNECLSSPCQHSCRNVMGSYTCSCYSCYTKAGTRCRLHQCRIAGRCYSYGTVNPRNKCQDCQRRREKVWTNNNALSCSDGNLCTRNDRCVNGACRGTAFTCRSCESCDGSGCRIKPGFCVIDGKCYTNGNIRSGKPCQQCNSNNPTRWTANNNLKCSDNNVKTRNDRCNNGECRGQPFTCLSCQDHYNDACRLKSGYCVVKTNNVDTCYRANTAKPGNPCQWCNPSITTSAWTNRNGISCDDGQKCTRSDTCKNGQCGGTTFQCNTLCQYCDGNGCSLNPGFGYVAGSCTCKIAGADYNHQQLNPSNECQWCDLYDKSSKASAVWTNKPSVTCNDSNGCTKQDLCHNGRCVGQVYSCQSSYPQSSCIQRSECVGDGTCRVIMRIKKTICRPAVDKCDQPERCNGVLGSCPSRTIDVITLQEGQPSLTFPNFANATGYQAITDKLYLKLTGFSVACGALTKKWSLLQSKDSCALRNNNSGILDNKNRQDLSGLLLQNGEGYKVVVQTYDMRGQSGLPVCSNIVTIDTSRPTGGWIRDGLDSNDIHFQSTSTISAHWGGFQAIYGIAKYEIAVYHNDTLLQSFTNVKLKASFNKTFSAIADGYKVNIKVRAFTKAGLYSEISSDGVTVDTSKPKPGRVSDGHSTSDLKYASWTSTYNASWTPFTDPHTRIVEYKLGIKRKDGGLLSSGLISVGLKLTDQISRLTLISGVHYCAIVEGVNAAGLSTQASSDCLLIDHDAPKPGTVNDGMSDDIDYQSADNVFFANWHGFDDGQKGSGLAEYKYKLTDKNKTYITSWVSAGLRTKINISGLSLLNGNTYYITVRAIDKVGHYKDVKSDGVFIDTSHPVYTGSINVQGEVAQKNGEIVVYISNNDSATLTWPQFIDTHSGMKKYQWTIAEKGEKLRSWKDVPGVKLATKAVLSFLSLTNNKEYQLAIRGINNAGLHADIKSPPLIPLSNPPDLGTVSDGKDPTIDIDYQTNTSEIYATWQGFETSSVIVRAYFIAVGSCIKGNYHVTNNQFIQASPAAAKSFGMQGLSLVNGQKYCIKIKAENLAGVQTQPVSSDGFIVDVTPPDLNRGMVLDGSGDDDVDYQSSREEISATWIGIQDYESDINYFKVAVSRNRVGQPDVTSFINVGHNTSVKLHGLSLNNDVYYVIVCAINNAGLKSCLSSDGVLVDPTPSTSGVVYDGILEPDIQYQSSTTKMSANWERIWDLESRVDKFEWGIGDKYPGSVMDFTDVGLQTHVATKKVLALQHGHNYTQFLRVYNRAGNMQVLSSNGVIIDTTPPVPGDITFGTEWHFNQQTQTYYSSIASGIYVTWRDFKEPESKIWYYKWAIGTTKCGTQMQPLINTGLATTANTSGSEMYLWPGVPYYVTIVARNRADLASRICSFPLIFDYTPPQAGSILLTSFTGTEKTYFSSNEDLRLSWFDVEDLESGLEKYEISVVRSNTTMLNYTLTSNQAKLDIPLNSLSPDTAYTVVFEAINYVGLKTRVVSKPFTIDDTPPVYTGREDSLPRRHFQSDSDTLAVAWQGFADSESPVEFYELGIGTQPLLDNIHKFTRTALRPDFELNSLNLQENQTYCVSVKAHNAAGLVTSLYLEAVVIDKTPPTSQTGSVKDGHFGNDIDFISPNDLISATWKHISDLQSGIDLFEYCVGSTPFNCLIKPLTSVGQNTSFVCHDCRIHGDVKVFARVKATNRAGISAIFTSNGITIDSSPPEIGRVLDGDKAESPDIEKVGHDWLPTVTWYGAQDIQSGLRDCQWTIVSHTGNGELIVYNKTLGEGNMTYNVRHTEKAAVNLQLITNASYVNAIYCTNNAGITSYQYSNGWSLVNQWPVTSYVYDGLESHDMEYDIIGETLSATWGAFYGDSKDRVIGYEWAVGTLETPEEIMEYTKVGLDTRVSKPLSDSDIELEPGVKYHVTVRATSLSGRTSNRSSNGFIVDRTAPTAEVVKVAHKILNQARNEIDYTLTWDRFQDLESGIRGYEFCLGYIKDVCSTDLTSAGSELQGTVQHFTPADLNTPFYGIVIATNNAGLKTTVSSDEIKIDFTPPIAGMVIDGVDRDIDNINNSVNLVTTWSGFEDPESSIKKCRLTVVEEGPSGLFIILRLTVNANGSIPHKFILIPGVRYTSTVECTNHDGFKTFVLSDGAVCDGSPPITGQIFHGSNEKLDIRYQSSTTTLDAYWRPGRDPESGIKEYLIAVGTGPDNDDVRGFVTVGMETDVKVVNLTMNSGSTYYITLEVVNNAGLKSRVSSRGVTVDTTPPIIAKANLQSSDAAPGFMGPGNYPSGNWSSYDDESDIDFTEYCIGTTAEGCQIHDMQRVSENQTSVTCIECKLKHRYTYFMTIRAWNKAGLFTLATTEGVTIDLTPPASGKVVLKLHYMPCWNTCSLGAKLSGFMDDESEIKQYELSIKNIDGTIAIPAQTTTRDSHVLANSLTLVHAKRYKMVVVCVNLLGERSTEVESEPLTIDNTPPEKGLVIISPDLNHDILQQHTGCHFLNTTLRVYWTGFHDNESLIAGFRVAIGRAPLGQDVIQYKNFNISSEAKFELGQQYGLSQGVTIFATVEATNRAGLVTKVSSKPTRLLLDTDKNLINEQDFVCVIF